MNMLLRAAGFPLALGFAIGMVAAGCDRMTQQRASGHPVSAMVNVDHELTAHADPGTRNDPAGRAFDDAAITATVKGKLLAAEDLSALDITVETTDGVVSLKGPAKNAQAREEASRITLAVDGVKAVVNDLAVNDTRPRRVSSR